MYSSLKRTKPIRSEKHVLQTWQRVAEGSNTCELKTFMLRLMWRFMLRCFGEQTARIITEGERLKRTQNIIQGNEP